MIDIRFENKNILYSSDVLARFVTIPLPAVASHNTSGSFILSWTICVYESASGTEVLVGTSSKNGNKTAMDFRCIRRSDARPIAVQICHGSLWYSSQYFLAVSMYFYEHNSRARWIPQVVNVLDLLLIELFTHISWHLPGTCMCCDIWT